MLDCIIDGLLDTLKVIPFLIIAFLILELIEHKLSKKNEKILENNKKIGPLIGGILGGIPQCGIGAMASNLFANRIITTGTLVAVYLSTSDEMLAILISEKASIKLIIGIVLTKVLIGIIIGFIVDLIYKRKKCHHHSNHEHIEEMCEDENCHCEEEGIFLSSIKHALKISLFILIVNIILNILIHLIGEDNLSNIILNKNIFTYFLSSLIGLIPNCASSVIITELYLSKLITLGVCMSGLLTGSGIGILILFKTNKDLKENITILSIIYIVGVISGILIDLFI